MKKSFLYLYLLLAALLFSFTSYVLGQSAAKPLYRRQNRSKRQNRRFLYCLYLLRAAITGSKMNEINDEYRTIEKTYSLPAGSDFKITTLRS